MRSAERREKIIEGVFVSQVDDFQASTPLVLITMKQIVVTHGNIEETTLANAGRVVVVILGAGGRDFYEVGTILRCRAEVS